MRRLLIADSSETYATVLARFFRDDMTVRICTDGMQLPSVLQKFRPDAMFLNLQLPRKDGISVLRESSYVPPVILATVNYLSPTIEQTATAAGVTYLMTMSAASAAASTLRLLMTQQIASPPSLQEKTAQHLQILGFPLHLAGSKQLILAVPLHIRDTTQPLNKFVYPAVAEEFGQTSERNVERSIRNAIHAAWKTRDPEVWESYFPGLHDCPSNKEFLSTIAQLLKI